MLDREELRQVIEGLKKRQRKHADWWEWLDKDGKELGIANDFAAALERATGEVAEHVELGSDPPDVVLTIRGGERIGIEITELVNQAAIKAQIKRSSGYAKAIFDWDETKIISRIAERVKDKETKCRALGNNTFRLILLLHTDEPRLSANMVEDAIRASGPMTSDVFSAVWLIFSHDPKTMTYPLIRLDRTEEFEEHTDV